MLYPINWRFKYPIFARMRIFNLIISLSLTMALTLLLNTKTGVLPPMGRFLDPVNGFWQNAEATDINAPEEIRLKGLSQTVKVRYDRHLIPHIFAQNEHDLYLTAGYITAYHRLWQMEFQVLDAAGRLSEIVGSAALERDRTTRRRGMVTSARETLKAWNGDPEISDALKAYTDGINQYIETLHYRDLPIEYKLLDYKPEQWTPLKSVLILKYMSAMLTLAESDIENTNTVKLFGIEQFNQLFPDFPEGIDPVIPMGTKWKFQPLEIKKPSGYDSLPWMRSRAWPPPSAMIGSNNWAVSGTKTKSGHPILANDMHLGLNLPCIWFQIQYHTPDMNIFGHNIPGIPLIITGFNDSIAWGFTNAYRDMVDWYTIKFRDEKRNEYYFDGHWLPTNKVIEEIKVRDEPAFYDTVVYTHHGPIVYDRNFPANNEKINLAMKWAAHDVSFEPKAFLHMCKAHNYDEFSVAISNFHCPPQNMAFACTNGDIALNIQGKYPLKWKGQGKFILDGTRKDNEWQGYIPQDQNLSVLNPERGFVSSANQTPADSTYPYYTYANHFEYNRNRRINRVLQQKNEISIRDMMDLQNDVYSLPAEEILPLMLANVTLAESSTEAKEILSALSRWNYKMQYSEKAPSYFTIWWRNLYMSVWDEFDIDTLALDYPSAFNTIRLLKSGGDNPFIDIQATPEHETVRDLVNLSFVRSLEDIRSWKPTHSQLITWQFYKNTGIRHLIPGLSAFSYEYLAIGGDGSTPNAATGHWGPSQRLIVDLGTPIRAWSTYAGGQSGNPGNKHYNHFIPSWVKGKYFPILFMHNPEESKDNILFRQQFTGE